MTGMSRRRGSACMRLQRGEAVEDRHHDVEEDDVDRLPSSSVGEQVKGGPAVLRLDDVVADRPQQPTEQASIERGVIDDQDPAGRSCRPPVDARGRPRQRVASASGRIGLAT